MSEPSARPDLRADQDATPETRHRLWPPGNSRIALPLVVAVWLVLVISGGSLLLRYQFSPGPPADFSESWPEVAPFSPAQGRATLVLFAHPRCPCTRATVGELARLMTRGQGRIQAHALFFSPKEADEAWAQTDLWESAAAIPGVTPHLDRDGRLARLFGAQTSGQTALYQSDGKLLFRGGITSARGHSGDNVGSTVILSLLDDPSAPAVGTRVFGCSLHTPESEKEEG